jgi:translation initiation factor eIF-2B subunit gamma
MESEGGGFVHVQAVLLAGGQGSRMYPLTSAADPAVFSSSGTDSDASSGSDGESGGGSDLVGSGSKSEAVGSVGGHSWNSSASGNAALRSSSQGGVTTPAKPLLPVANRPLISYALELLIREGFRHVLIVTTPGSEDGLRYWLENEFPDHSRGLAWSVVCCGDDAADRSRPDGGSADALLAARKHIKTQNFVVISADTIVLPGSPGANAEGASSAAASPRGPPAGSESEARGSASPWLSRMLALHRANNSTATVLLKRQPELSAEAEKAQARAGAGTAAGDQGAVDYVGLSRLPSCETSDAQLLFFRAAADVEDSGLRIHNHTLSAANGTLTMHRNLLDTHIYVFSRWVLDLLYLNSDQKEDDDSTRLHSLKGELLPLLVKMQTKRKVGRFRVPDYSPATSREQSRAVPLHGGRGARSHGSGKERSWGDRLADLSSAPQGEAHLRRGRHGHDDKKADAPVKAEEAKDLRLAVKCYAYILDEDHYCTRVNTIKTFLAANRDVPHFAPPQSGIPATGYLPWEKQVKQSFIHNTAKLIGKTQIGPECVVGASTEVNEKVSVKKANIGSHCKIGKGVKIENSVIMDHVSIADRCAVKNCVISAHCVLGTMTSLTNCHVAVNHTFEEKTKASGATFCNEESFM